MAGRVHMPFRVRHVNRLVVLFDPSASLSEACTCVHTNVDIRVIIFLHDCAIRIAHADIELGRVSSRSVKVLSRSPSPDRDDRRRGKIEHAS